MSKLTIRIENHEQKYTVSEMRRRLAQVLSKLNGDQEVSFTFVAQLEHYTPAPRVCAKNPALGAPYDFNQPDLHLKHLGGLWGYARFAEQAAVLREGENIVHGEFARPEND